MTLVAEIDRYCERAGMDQEEPHRMALLALGRGVDEVDGKLARFGDVVGQKAGASATDVVRSEMRRLLLGANALRVALYVAVPVVTLALGYWAGATRPVSTEFGRLSPETVRLLQANDLDAAVKGCEAQRPQAGQEWCKMRMWRPRAAPPA